MPHTWIRRGNVSWFCMNCGFEWIYNMKPSPDSRVPEDGDMFQVAALETFSCEELIIKRTHNA